MKKDALKEYDPIALKNEYQSCNKLKGESTYYEHEVFSKWN